MGLLSQLSGTLVNVGAVLLGTLLGLTLGGRLPERTQRTLLQTLSLVTLFIALDMAGSLNKVTGGSIPGVLLALLSLALGVVIGEALGIEEALTRLGDDLKRRFKGGGRFTEGFVAASLLFCIGPMTVIGGLQNGLTGDSSTYVLKSTLDGIAALALASAYGIGVGFSAITVLLIQGGISLAAGSFAAGLLGGADPSILKTNPYVLLITGAGGLMIVGISWNLMLAGLGLEDRRVRVGSMLPALLLAPLLLLLASRLG
ncbi:putative membrane protein YdfK [Deinococcus xinjiangensis]|uniref:Membrane protein YdfK n=1 Tax=Deinococcus xinjiangensis TaxID=457454 RepID=A0ABP9VBI3_9DEIO